MNILIIDGQGGGIGQKLVERVRKEFNGVYILAIGTNSGATAAMLKAGADAGATGESPVMYNCPRADLILGPLGILVAGALMGEISPKIALAIAECEAPKVLIPVSRCHAFVAGVEDKPVAKYLDDAVGIVRKHISEAQENPREKIDGRKG